ncbi:SDR family oxidoreductase [Sporosarcina sp. HYO08]|uniref:SDR family NAD(P)-dependent oxidoreductase n=1 Tax=Sporosarcina sp. HYO08 TaxID=1759557 RepID=UPI00079B2E82|nr:SDR family NAD(P)-dependent oxidoreductase [Sporosarcina sp. HYO08]KXH81691.1 oxidoreductase [Sporosarcina sp. HYO08]
MHKRKSVFITGATSGVGYALTKKLLADQDHYHVIGTGRAPDAIWTLQNEGAHMVRADLSRPEEVDFLLTQVGTPDIVVFSAGVGRFATAHETSDEAMHDMMNMNAILPMQLTKRLLPDMIQRGSGHLIYIGSQAGKVATPKAAVYAASKHAIIGFTDALRMEVAPFGIHVTAIHPGPIDTPFLDVADDTGHYRKALGNHLLSVDAVCDAVIKTIEQPVREVNLPGYMGVTSKLHAIAPGLVERIGRKFFTKK